MKGDGLNNHISNADHGYLLASDLCCCEGHLVMITSVKDCIQRMNWKHYFTHWIITAEATLRRTEAYALVNFH